MSDATVLALAVLPESILHTRWYAVLSGFVAINTILYVTLSILKIMPKIYVNDFLKRHGRRSETRSIYPDGHGPPADYRPEPGSLAARHATWSGSSALEGPTDG
jgi:hypothetical protein